MSRLKIIAALLAFLIGFCTFALVNTRHVGRSMQEIVREARQKKIDGDAIDRLETAWEKYEPLLDIYSRHDEVERISRSIEKLRPLYRANQSTELRLALSETDNALEHLMETEMPAIHNIL